MKRFSIVRTIAAVLLLSGAALAAEVHGVRLPDSVVVDQKPLTLNGIGVRTKTFLKIKVYVAGLYVETRTHDAARLLATDSVRRLEIQMTHKAPSRRVASEIREGVTQNASGNMPALAERLELLCAKLPDLDEGQKLTFTYIPGVGTRMTSSTGSELVVPGKDFADALFSAWVGKNPLDEELKQRLLGGT